VEPNEAEPGNENIKDDHKEVSKSEELDLSDPAQPPLDRVVKLRIRPYPPKFQKLKKIKISKDLF